MLNLKQISELFSYKNANTFYNSTKKAKIIKGVREIERLHSIEMQLLEEKYTKKIELLSSNISSIEKSLKELEFIKLSI